MNNLNNENHSFWDVYLPFFLKTPTCAFYETVLRKSTAFKVFEDLLHSGDF